MITINDIFFICNLLVNGMTLPTTDYLSFKDNELIKTSEYQTATDKVISCAEVGIKALHYKLDPVMAIAIAKRESKFTRDIVGGLNNNTVLNKYFKLLAQEFKPEIPQDISGKSSRDPSVGLMQVIPKYWCKEQTNQSIWNSRTNILYLPKTPRECFNKKRKALKLKQNHFFNELCEQKYCDDENCIKKECDLQYAGMIALRTYYRIYRKDNLQLICHYNLGQLKPCPTSALNYAKEIIGSMDSINKKLKTRKKNDDFISFLNKDLPLFLQRLIFDL